MRIEATTTVSFLQLRCPFLDVAADVCIQVAQPKSPWHRFVPVNLIPGKI